MAWFGKRQSVVDRRLREIDKELENLDAQVRRLRRGPGKGAASKPASTAYPSNRPPPAAPPARVQGGVSFGAPRQRELWPRPAQEEQAPPASNGARRWWRLFFPRRQKPADPKLVSYLSTGSFKTVRPLRHERRMARYRFVFSFALLAGTLLVLMLALRNC